MVWNVSPGPLSTAEKERRGTMLYIKFCTTRSLFPALLRCRCLLFPRRLLLRLLLLPTVIPRARIAQAAPALALAQPAKLLGQVLRRDLREQLVPIRGVEDVDLADGDLVKPALDHGPDGGERPGRIDDVELAHDLRVAVLPDRRGGHDVVLDAVKVGERDVLQVHDRAERLDRVPDRARRGRHARRQRALVLADQPVEQPLLRRDRVERLEVQLAQSLNVDRAAVLKRNPSEPLLALEDDGWSGRGGEERPRNRLSLPCRPCGNTVGNTCPPLSSP